MRSRKNYQLLWSLQAGYRGYVGFRDNMESTCQAKWHLGLQKGLLGLGVQCRNQTAAEGVGGVNPHTTHLADRFRDLGFRVWVKVL